MNDFWKVLIMARQVFKHTTICFFDNCRQLNCNWEILFNNLIGHSSFASGSESLDPLLRNGYVFFKKNDEQSPASFLITFGLFKWQYYKLINLSKFMGCQKSSVVMTVPTILKPWVQIHTFFILNCWNCRSVSWGSTNS